MDWNNINEDRDTSGLGPIEYDQSKVPQLIRKHADNVRGKSYGQQVREAQARNAELAGLIASEASLKVDAQDDKIDELDVHFNNAISAVTVDTEVLDARIATDGTPRETLSKRIADDFEIKKKRDKKIEIFVDDYKHLITDDGDWTQAVHQAVREADTGGVVVFPRGEIKCNLLFGHGGLPELDRKILRGVGGSILKPFDASKTCLQINDGSWNVGDYALQDLTLLGTDDELDTGDGLFIYGTNFAEFKNVKIYGFGGNNVVIKASMNASNQFLYFSNFSTFGSKSSNLYVDADVGTKMWNSAIYFTNFFMNTPRIAKARNITNTIRGGLLSFTNGYIESNNVNETGMYLDSPIDLTNVNLDGLSSDAIVAKTGDNVDVSYANRLIPLSGKFTLHGRLVDKNGNNVTPVEKDGAKFYNLIADKYKFTSTLSPSLAGGNQVYLAYDEPKKELVFKNKGYEFRIGEGYVSDLRMPDLFKSQIKPISPLRGRMVYDRESLKPLFGDGTNWRDAAGNIVTLP